MQTVQCVRGKMWSTVHCQYSAHSVHLRMGVSVSVRAVRATRYAGGGLTERTIFADQCPLVFFSKRPYEVGPIANMDSGLAGATAAMGGGATAAT